MSFIETLYSKSPIFFQSIFLNAKAAELYFERYGKKFWKRYNEFLKNQWMSRSDLEELQSINLKRLIKHAYKTVPYYQHKMRKLNLTPNDIQSIHDLYKIPILTKQDIKKNTKNLLSTSYSQKALKKGHTSGTTGSPLDLYYDIQTCVIHHAADWRQKKWAGLEYGQPYASIQGRIIVPLQQKRPPFWRKNFINNQLFLSSFHLKEKNLSAYFEKLDKDNIKYIEGYPSTIYILAMYLHKHKKKFPIKAVLTSSETLFDFQRDLIEKMFCCKIFDFYGMAERTVFATECNLHTGHHLNSDYGITEFLDGDNNPVAPGKFGKIIATSLHNFAMPLIRYQTNDSCSLKEWECNCGRGFPLMEEVATKNESIIKLSDGRLISPSVLTHPFKPLHNIKESQIIQKDTNRLLIKLVILPGYCNLDELHLKNAFKDRLGNDIIIDIDYVDSIPRTPSGKFKWVVSEINAIF